MTFVLFVPLLWVLTGSAASRVDAQGDKPQSSGASEQGAPPSTDDQEAIYSLGLSLFRVLLLWT